MLATIITEEKWLKLKSILLDLNVYDKPSLKETFLAIIYRLKTGCPWRYLVDPEQFSKPVLARALLPY